MHTAALKSLFPTIHFPWALELEFQLLGQPMPGTLFSVEHKVFIHSGALQTSIPWGSFPDLGACKEQKIAWIYMLYYLY